MNITIIVFSPSGNSLATAKLIEKSFTNKDSNVQLIDFTGNKEIADRKGITEYLNKLVNPHDVLFIGGPVYIGHIQENVKSIIKALPLPDGKWSPLVIPFVSYGGVHSSIALKEAGRLLKARKRINISGLKIASSHSLTKNFTFDINEIKPGIEEIQIIESMVERVSDIIQKKQNEIEDVSSSFSYSSFGETLLYSILSEKVAHKIMFNEKNSYMGIALDVEYVQKKCPVQIIEMINKKPVIQKKAEARCCYCAECLYNCKFNAIIFDLSKSRNYLANILKENKLESPQSAVF